MKLPPHHPTWRTLAIVLLGLLTVGVLSCSGSKTIIDEEISPDVPPPPGCSTGDHCGHITTNCAKGICNTDTGECALENRPYGSKCIPNQACALGICADGQCQAERVLNCDDGNPCTTDLCDMEKDGCIHTPQQADCVDGNPCTENDTCQQGTCTGGTYVCQQCATDEDCAIYNDTDACNGVLNCDPSSNECRIAPGSKITCLSSQSCMASHCDTFTGTCVETPKANGQPCQDGDLCTLEDRCQDGQCKGATLLCINNQGACQSAQCTSKGGCSLASLSGQPCVDGNLCTDNDSCSDGLCAGQTATSCACNQDEDCALYDDGDLCTGMVRCLNKTCQTDPDTVVYCPLFGKPCISLQCAPETGECVPSMLQGACTDGDLCTENDQCDKGVCQAQPLVCDDGDECTTDLCLPSIGCAVEFIPDCHPKGCTDGTVGLCGACGTRTCVGDTWGPCENEKTCVAGAVESASCGYCGEQTRACNDECEWNDWEACNDEGPCTPGQTDSQSCGPCDSQDRTCGTDCQWGNWGQCVQTSGCTQGETQSQGCGQCGSQQRVCDGGCNWSGWGACSGEGPCSPKDTQSCGQCGSQTCENDCEWGGCNDGGCYPGTKAIYRYYWYDDSGGQLNNANHMIRTVKDTGGYDYKGNHYDYEGKHFELFVSDNGPDLIPLYQSYSGTKINHLPSTTSDGGADLGYTGHKIIGYCSSKQTSDTPNQLTRIYANQLIDHFATINPDAEIAAGQGYYVQGGNLCWVP